MSLFVKRELCGLNEIMHVKGPARANKDLYHYAFVHILLLVFQSSFILEARDVALVTVLLAEWPLVLLNE